MANYDVTTAAASLNFETNAVGVRHSACKIDTNHIFVCIPGAGSGDGYAYVLTVNTSTWAITTASTPLDFETASMNGVWALPIDANHFLVCWRSAATSGRAQVLTVNTSTWAITTAGSQLAFSTTGDPLYSDFHGAVVDANHFIMMSQSYSTPRGEAQILAVNTTTWAVTTAAASLNYSVFGSTGSIFKVDTNHFIAIYGSTDGDGFAVVFAVNTTTWVITTAAAQLEIDTQNFHSGWITQIDANHFVSVYGGGTSSLGYIETLTVNTSTWAITTAAARLNFDTVKGEEPSVIQIDTNQFLVAWHGAAEDGFIQVFTVNTTTYAVTTTTARLEYDTQNGYYNILLQIDSSHYVNIWGGGASFNGWAQTFAVELPVTTSLKTIDGLAYASVKTVNGLAIASVKTVNGLA